MVQKKKALPKYSKGKSRLLGKTSLQTKSSITQHVYNKDMYTHSTQKKRIKIKTTLSPNPKSCMNAEF